jgi:hypothetical protein
MAIALAAAEPLPLPENFDPEVSMMATKAANATFHETRDAAGFAQRLVANGTPQDLELAEKVLNAVLQCQELREHDAHYGNFWWLRENGFVEDLNAVEFTLSHLIPMMVMHGDRLPSDVQQRVRESIRLGLAEIRKLDVLIAYTNICSLDVLNSCLGGELLNDPATAQCGYTKLVQWMAFTDTNGTVFEFNSPVYTPIAVESLATLAQLTKDADTRIRARTFAARIALDAALHIHRATGRWAGPHSRAYRDVTLCERRPEGQALNRWITRGEAPAWLGDVLETPSLPMQIVETSDRTRGHVQTTYHSQSFALGVTSRELIDQTNPFIAHYVRPGLPKPGVVFSRYLINDKWIGPNPRDVSKIEKPQLFDDGRFLGVQDGPRAIGLYAPRSLGRCSSAKAALILAGRDQVDEIWTGDNRIDTLPAPVPRGQVVVIGSGAALIAVRPLTVTDLGRDAPIQLVEKDGCLVLEIYNYLGLEKTFWEMEWPGGFYKGQPQCGFYAEFAERAEYPNGKAFGETVARGNLKDEAQAPFTYMATGERPWSIEYARDGRTLGIQVDLMEWKLQRRWT